MTGADYDELKRLVSDDYIREHGHSLKWLEELGVDRADVVRFAQEDAIDTLTVVVPAEFGTRALTGDDVASLLATHTEVGIALGLKLAEARRGQ